MQIESIENAIKELESAETTLKNVEELACLYIIRNNLSTASNSAPNGVFLPYYNLYVEDKRRFQQNEVSDAIIKEDIQYVCREITDFLTMLYNCTDSEFERIEVQSMFKNIHEKFCKKN